MDSRRLQVGIDIQYREQDDNNESNLSSTPTTTPPEDLPEDSAGSRIDQVPGPGDEVVLRKAGESTTNEVQQSFGDLVQLLRDQPEREAAQLLRRLRKGESINNLLTRRRDDTPLQNLSSTVEKNAFRILLFDLLRSKKSLKHIVSDLAFETGKVQAPYISERAKIPHSVFDGSGFLGRGQRPSLPAQIGSNAWRKRAGTVQLSNQPPYTNDALDIPHWRFFEPDLFLRGMLSGKVGSEFCSPLLVNAICALACLQSDDPDAFVESGELSTRGQHFHDEALHLWLQQDGRASIVNLQALTILAEESSWRGKDKLGMTFIAVALRMNQELELSDIANPSATALEAGRARARLSIAWTVHLEDAAFANGLLKVSAPVDYRLQDTPLLPDREYAWSGRPFSPVFIRYRSNALFRERSALTRLITEVNHLLFSPELQDSTALMRWAQAWDSKTSNWYQNLPEDLRYDKDLPVPVFELHAQYHCTMVTFCSSLDTCFQARSLDGAIQKVDGYYTAGEISISSRLSARRLSHATWAASMCRDYRERYSLRASVPFMFQIATMSAFALLQWLHDNPDQSSPSTGQIQDELPGGTMHPRSAFEETYRGMLASATQVMVARGALALLNQTASHLGVELPHQRKLESTIHGITWRRSDLKQISSIFPNYAQGSTPTFSKATGMEDILKEWENFLPYR
ncbi:hypothetical protein LTR01_001697 [Friedmanniomyces endolithicus]|nr:hypothetical protein LTR01_001697 [Friedmanniomyces endolithicus]KAK0830230.1 hypothetical protein LTR73_003508 [Friedmanniomyces endolithicus]